VAPAWIAQCTAPAAPLTDAAIAEGFGRDDLRRVDFDCTRGWLYPGDGAAPGWYALHAAAVERAAEEDAFLAARLAPARRSYTQRRAGRLPPFALYEQPAGPMRPEAQPPQPFDLGALAWVGYSVTPAPRRGRSVEFATWWRVDAVPDRPLSLLLHLVGPGGSPTLVGDGLAIPPTAWRVGDLLVQRHTLDLPVDAPAGPYTPYTGVYWLDTLERWPVTDGPQAGANAIALPPVDVP
jgi:hypothetical protein